MFHKGDSEARSPVVIIAPLQLNVHLSHLMVEFGWDLEHVTGSGRGSK